MVVVTGVVVSTRMPKHDSYIILCDGTGVPGKL